VVRTVNQDFVHAREQQALTGSAEDLPALRYSHEKAVPFDFKGDFADKRSERAPYQEADLAEIVARMNTPIEVTEDSAMSIEGSGRRLPAEAQVSDHIIKKNQHAG